jgi:hypothetical protein
MKVEKLGKNTVGFRPTCEANDIVSSMFAISISRAGLQLDLKRCASSITNFPIASLNCNSTIYKVTILKYKNSNWSEVLDGVISLLKENDTQK